MLAFYLQRDLAMSSAPSPRTRIRRIPENADYAPSTLYAILDSHYLCHLAFHDERGPHCLPMAYWRIDDALYIHGSNGSRLMKHLAGGAPVSIAVSHLDGLVLARSAFNHSMNYRSAVIYGQFERIEGEEAKAAALDAFMDHLAPGRNAEIRRGSPQELGATIVLKISLAEAACKIRSGGAEDDEKDLHIAAWTGVLPLTMTRGEPQADADCTQPLPAYAQDWSVK